MKHPGTPRERLRRIAGYMEIGIPFVEAVARVPGARYAIVKWSGLSGGTISWWLSHGVRPERVAEVAGWLGLAERHWHMFDRPAKRGLAVAAAAVREGMPFFTAVSRFQAERELARAIGIQQPGVMRWRYRDGVPPARLAAVAFIMKIPIDVVPVHVAKSRRCDATTCELLSAAKLADWARPEFREKVGTQIKKTFIPNSGGKRIRLKKRLEIEAAMEARQ